MVVIDHRDWVDALEAYSTAPLTLEMNRTVQHGFYNGTYARFGDPQVTVTIHDRPKFHGKSHYDLRNLLDSEGMEDGFIVVDETTPDLDALWYVLPTGYEMDRVKAGRYRPLPRRRSDPLARPYPDRRRAIQSLWLARRMSPGLTRVGPV